LIKVEKMNDELGKKGSKMKLMGLKEGGAYKIRLGERYKDLRDYASKHEFLEYLEAKIRKDLPIRRSYWYDIGLKLFVVLLWLLFALLAGYLAFVLYSDLKIALESDSLQSPLTKIYLTDYFSPIVYFYIIQIIFVTMILILLIIGIYNILRTAISKNYNLNSNIIYLMSFLKSLNKDERIKIVEFDERNNSYRMIGSYSSLDPKKTYNAFQAESIQSPLYHTVISGLFFLLMLVILITNFLLFPENMFENLELNASNIIVYVTSLGVFFSGLKFITSISDWISKRKKYTKYINELIAKQQEEIFKIMIHIEKAPSGKKELFSELDRAQNELITIKKAKQGIVTPLLLLIPIILVTAT
jgi:hypothetical protein